MANKRYSHHCKKVKLTELAYVAGVIDGDGSITIARIKHPRTWDGYTYVLEIIVGMSDTIIPPWLHDTFGGTLRLRILRGGRKPQYIWRVFSKEAARILETLLPYLKLKHQQAETAIEFQKLKKHRGVWHEGNQKPHAVIEAEAILRNKMHDLNHTKWEVTDGHICNL